MKKIVAAWIEQLESGLVKVRIRKQYNNNAFPDDLKGGE